MSNEFDRWFVCSAPPVEPRFRLLCVPYAGGSASNFRTWGPAAPASVEVCAVQLPGRQKRVNEPPLHDANAAAVSLAAALEEVSDLPYAVFGDCTGAFVALELCRARRRAARRLPSHLFVVGCRAPHFSIRHVPIHTLADEAMAISVRDLGMIPAWLAERDDYLRDFLPLLRADFEMAERYTSSPNEPFSFPITAFAGRFDTVTTHEEVEGWSAYTTAPLSLKLLDGGHDLTKTHQLRILDEVFRLIEPEDERSAIRQARR